MVHDIRRSIVALLALTVLLGGAYPVVVWAIGQVAFNHQAQGSLVVRNGTVVGSSLLAQAFTQRPATSIRGRPRSTTTPAARGRPTSARTRRTWRTPSSSALAAVAKAERVAPALVPVDLVTASASGLDPDISREAALLQVDRVARARRLDPGEGAGAGAVEAWTRRPPGCSGRRGSTCSTSTSRSTVWRGDRERPDARPRGRAPQRQRRTASLAAFVVLLVAACSSCCPSEATRTSAPSC